MSRVFRFVGSYGLAVTIVVLLGVITWLGTLAQVEMGLFRAQKVYFESFLVLHKVPLPGMNAPLRIPLPGGYLLMAALFVNLVAGGIIRLRWTLSRAGILTTHVGVLMLLAGGFVTYTYARDGHLTLREHEASNLVRSYHDWELVVSPAPGENGRAEAVVVPGDAFVPLAGTERTATIRSDHLPFDLELSRILRNSWVEPSREDVPGLAAGGVRLKSVEPETEAELNRLGAMVRATPNAGGEAKEAVLLGGLPLPWCFEMDGRLWGVTIQRRSWELPFTVVLDHTERTLHPGTNKPASYASEITKIDPDDERRIRISMNEPLRHQGITLFQSGWRQDPTGKRESTFAVVQNPADSVPLWACAVIAVGMTFHFSRRLFVYLRRRESRR